MGSEKIILFVGGFRAVKGVKYLIEAMAIIIQKDMNVRLMLVGDGADRYELEELVNVLGIEKYVVFVGKVPPEKVVDYMVASTIFVLPSISEGFPNVILEAMASGLPIVATRVGGLPDILEHKKNGFLVEPRKPKDLAEKVLLILNNDELSKSISETNKELVKEYSWNCVITKLEGLYRNTCK